MYKWMDKTGKRLKDSAWVDEEKSPYLGHLTQQPFPLNPFFRSERVLSEEMRQLLVEEVREKKKPIKVVSIEQGVDARRIAAVLRMKDIERQWKQEVSAILPFSQHPLPGNYYTASMMIILSQID